MNNKYHYNYEERIKNSHKNFPAIQDALIEYWNTIYDLTKRIKPENFRKPAWKPIITLDVGYNDPKYHNGVEGFWVIFQSEPFPINSDTEKIIKSAINEILQTRQKI